MISRLPPGRRPLLAYMRQIAIETSFRDDKSGLNPLNTYAAKAKE